jgi:tetratricopeptide (TPR) repeat protein
MLLMAVCCGLAAAQKMPERNYRLTLTEHKGQLSWSANGFKIIQSSAKANGHEIGLRGQNDAARLNFLGFLFVIADSVPLTGDRCRDAIMGQAKKNVPGMKMLSAAQLTRPNSLPISLVTYSALSRGGAPWFAVRGFVAAGDLCGDLELSSNRPLGTDDADIKTILSTYQLLPGYAPQFADVFRYAQVLYQMQLYSNAAPVFEKALTSLGKDATPFPSLKIARRVMTDEAGMAYRLAGALAKARATFTKGVAADPDYPTYYYNLACVDAGEKNLADARLQLQKAFARKANVNPGETMPDPTKDSAFLPYRSDTNFWSFIEGLRAAK